MLYNWYKTELGKALWKEEQKYILQMQTLYKIGLFLQLGTVDKLTVGDSFLLSQSQLQPDTDILVNYNSMPFFDSCIGSIYLSHILEYVEEPHQVLREVKRVLVPEGVLMISFFNIISVWGLRSFIKNESPWKGQFFYQAKIIDWLSLLDFEVFEVHRVFNRLPINQKCLLEKMSVLERFPWKVFSASTIILAKKRVLPLTPIFNRKKSINEFKNYLPEPSASKNK